MKKAFPLILFVVLFPIISTAASYKFKASVDVASHHVQGTPIMAKVTVSNALGEDFEMTTGGGGNWFFGQKQCRGHMPLIDTAPPDPHGPPSPSKPYRYPSDWVKKHDIDLADYCDLKSPGQYSLEYRYAKTDGSLLADPVTVNFSIEAPMGEDKTAYDSYQACLKLAERKKGDSWQQCKRQLLSDHPTSIYSGWALKDSHFEAMGTFGKNESATRAIMAVIKRNEEDLQKYWQFDSLAANDQKTRDRKTAMKNLVEASESFVASHPDFSFSGWILARAGFNALGLSDFGSACVDLKRSLELAWELPGASKNAEPSGKEGVTYALELLKKHGYCKKD